MDQQQQLRSIVMPEALRAVSFSDIVEKNTFIVIHFNL